MKTPKIQQIPLCVESEFPACFESSFGPGIGKRDPILTLLERNLPDFENEVGFVLAEVLEIQRIGGKAKVFIYSQHKTDDERKEFKREYFDLIYKLFKERKWSLSTCANLYFGDGVTHKVFCAVVDSNNAGANKSEKPQWNIEPIEHDFQRNYEELVPQDADTVDVAWKEYVTDFNDLRQKVDGSRYFYNLLIPIAFHSPQKTAKLRKALGAIFLAFGTNTELSREHLMSLYCRIQLFWHYNYSAEATARLIEKNDELEKYRDMFNLLKQPLDSLGGAIHSMQQDIRGLNAVLYEPAEGLFRFHKAVVDLFDDGRTIVISKNVRLTVQHNSNYRDPKEAALIIAVAMWRLLGLPSDEGGLRNERNEPMKAATTPANALTIIKETLSRRLEAETGIGVYRGVFNDILYVCFPKVPIEERRNLTINDLLSDKTVHRTEASVDERVGRLKGVLFSPFKLQTNSWHPRALQIALKNPDDENSVRFSEKGKSEWNLQDWQMLHDWTPIGYGAVLDFLLKCSAQFKNRSLRGGKDKGLSLVEVKPIRDALDGETEFSIQLYFKGEQFFKPDDDEGKLYRLINEHVLRFPRDWRVEQTTLGNFQKPFVDLCNKILGLHQSELSESPIFGWAKQTVPYDPNATEHQLLLLERPKVVSADEAKGSLKSRFFELTIGATSEVPGITLRWFEGATSENLREKT
jgi:hypothetical protein